MAPSPLSLAALNTAKVQRHPESRHLRRRDVGNHQIFTALTAGPEGGPTLTKLGVVGFAWRGELADEEVFALTRSHGGHAVAGWWDRIRPHSLGWVTARLPEGTLIGFANVAWDGGDHAFLLDPKVRPDHQRRGIGTELVRLAARNAKEAGCEWMEVDFEDTERLKAFYFEACGFTPTNAGLLHLPDLPGTS